MRAFNEVDVLTRSRFCVLIANETEQQLDRFAEELGEQFAYEGTTEMKRRLRRGDESKGAADLRVSGWEPDSIEDAGSIGYHD